MFCVQVTLSDRALMPGDVVRRLVEGNDSQRGYVTYSYVRCHLQVLNRPTVICDVDTRDLLYFVVGAFVNILQHGVLNLVRLVMLSVL